VLTFSIRSPDVFQGDNHIHFGPTYSNYIVLPLIPKLAEEDQNSVSFAAGEIS